MTKRLYRIPEQGQLTGVAAGLADYFNIDPTIVRVLFVIAAFLTDGLVVLGYFLLAIILRTKQNAKASFGERLSSMFEAKSDSGVRNWIGFGLILIGGWFLVGHLWPGMIDINWGVLWPIILVLIGVIILIKGKR